MVELRGLKVAFLAGTLGQGGAERQLYYMLSVLRESGALPRVLSLTQGEYWQKPFEALGVGVTSVGRTGNAVVRLAQIIGAVIHDRPDVLQSQHFFANSYVSVAGRMLGISAIGAIRGDGFEEREANPGLSGWCSLKLPAALAANSTAGIDNAVTLGARRDRLFLVPNAVDTTFFTPASERPANGPIRMLAVGSLVHIKRFDRLIRIMSLASSRSALPVRAFVVGAGPLRSELESQRHALGLSEQQISFCGAASDMREWYRMADMLVLTSDREGTPNVVLEAMACGLPVVATRVGGVPEIVVNDETGFVIDPGDELGLADAVLKLAADRESRLRFGSRARKLVETTHSLSRLRSALSELYGAVLAPKSWRDINRRAVSKLNDPSLSSE